MVQDACNLAHQTQNLVVQTTMLESQPNIDQVNPEGKGLGRLVCSSRKDVGGSDSSAMDDSVTDDVHGCTRDVSGMSGTSPRSWKDTRERFSTETIRCCADLGSELFVQTWRERPRDASSFFGLLLHNVVAFTLVLLSGIITWESSVNELRSRIDRTIVFPLYLPHSVALAVACIWTTAAAPGNLVGLYLVRMYMIWRGHLGFTSLNTTVMFLAAFLATLQSHIGAYFLRKFLCAVSLKRFPTIDSAKEAVWYLITVFFLSLVFSTVISLCIAITPLLQWTSFWTYWGTWWLGVLATMITVTPLLTHLLAWEYESSLRSPGNLLECLLCVVATSAIMAIVFFVNFENFRVLPYLCFPLITWTAFRFNRVGWAITVSTVAYCCALGTVRRTGALYNLRAPASPSSPELIIQVELFSCVVGIISIILAAAVKEKKVLTQKLHQLNIELEQTVDLRTLELRKANEELQVSQRKAVQASHAKSDFLANMSHEIRTPIHGILGLTALLLESELTPDQTESLESVKECADLLLHIINSVLDLAKIEAGRLEVEKVPFNIRKMVSSTFRMLQARAQQRGLKLLWEVDKCVPQTLVGDVGKLQQCLLNLVGNSLKFTHKGLVTVSVRLAADQTTMPLDINDESAKNVVGASGDKSSEGSLNQEAPGRVNVEFEVRDTGIGISQEKLLDMFKPFTQAEASTSRLYGGTGLGLCIVQRFVELLGGTISAESELGKGSAFYIRLPFYPNKPAESSSVSSPKVFPDKIHGRQSWSLMGGLIFNPSGKYQNESNQLESGAHTWNSNLAARVRTTNDLLGLFKDNKGAGLGNFDGIDSSAVNGYSPDFQGSKYRLGAVRKGSYGPEHYAWAAPELVQGGSNPVVEDQLVEKTLSDPASALNECNMPLKWDSVRSDRGASSEVTQLLQPESLLNRVNSGNPESWELVQSQNFVSVSSQTSSTFSDWGVGTAFLRPHEGSMDSDPPEGEEALHGAMERERGNVIGLAGNLSVVVGAHYPRGESTSVRSDLSRESSAELEKLLDGKVSLNILLAEDNAINQKVASRQLEKHGHVVTIVGDGQQALEAIISRHDEFDLVLMDVQMPTMDGLRATDLIRKAERENSWTRVPVLGLTAHAIQGYQETCLQHGMDGYLGKPFDIHQLLKTIGHLLPPDRLGQRP